MRYKAAVVWAIPDIIREECPLPAHWEWKDETTDVFASLKHIDYGDVFAVLDRDDGVEVCIVPDNNYTHFDEGEEEQALRYVYAQFLFNGPTT